MLVGVLLNATANPPPAIAEIAPQAVQAIQQSNQSQSAPTNTKGTGQGRGGASPSPATSPGATPPAAGAGKTVPRAKDCQGVGGTTLEIEDPQSPPCIYWDESLSNGGATWSGDPLAVTADSVGVGMPAFYSQPLLNFFNNRFQLYNRKLADVGPTSCPDASQTGQQALSQSFISAHAFGIVDGVTCGHGTFLYEDFARQGRIAVGPEPLFDTAGLENPAWAGRLWQYPMPTDRLAADIGSWVCQRLKDGLAVRAGADNTTQLSTETRRFGLFTLQESSALPPIDDQPLVDKLDSCIGPHATPGNPTGSWDYESVDQVSDFSYSTDMQWFESRKDTSIICVCDISNAVQWSRAASSIDYHPEWLLSSYLFGDYPYSVRETWPPDQQNGILGLSTLPDIIPAQDTYAWRAFEEGNGAIDANSADYRSDILQGYQDQYKSLLLLAAGIQAAGPDLTPETFARGLWATQFPNPPTPDHQGRVGFPGQSMAMTQDVVEWFWSTSGQEPYQAEPAGAMCYLAYPGQGYGARFGYDEWPARAPDSAYAPSAPCVSSPVK